MSIYTVGDTAQLTYTFLIETAPTDAAHCHYSVSDEDGALLAGEEPAQVVSIKKLPVGNRYRVKVSAGVVIPDTSYDSLTVDFFLRDESVGLEESGSTEIDETVDIEEPNNVIVALFNVDVLLENVLPYSTAGDAVSSSIRLSMDVSQTRLRGEPFELTVKSSEPYAVDMLLAYSAQQLQPVNSTDLNLDPGYIESIAGQVVLPAYTTSVTFQVPSQVMDPLNLPASGAIDHALLTLEPPVGTGIPVVRTRLITRLPEEGEDVPRYIAVLAYPIKPGYPGVKVEILDPSTAMVFEPYVLTLELRQAIAGSGTSDIDFPTTRYEVPVTSPQSVVQIPVYVSEYPDGVFAKLVAGVGQQPNGQQIKVLNSEQLISIAAPVITTPEVPV